MSHPGKMITVNVDVDRGYQKIDGFGVNINSKNFEPRLIPALDLLVNDLGASLYRVDIWGKSNWLDPDGSLGREKALAPEHQAGLYSGEIFRRGWGMMRWLNQQGIRPYLTASGIVPPWMLGADGKTLADFDGFTSMMAEMLAWARQKEGLDFDLFGPLNETDIGDPEGPTVGPRDYTRVCEMLVEKLAGRGMGDIRLVVAEQANFNSTYLEALTASQKLQGRIGAFGLHDYWDIPPEVYQQVTGVVRSSPFAQTPVWMTEYGDLEQTGEREWYVAWLMTSRLFDQLSAGFSGSLVWDAYDNYHDHDEHWTIYGLLRTGLRAYTPKKRYHASKQVFRFVRPGFARVAVEGASPSLRVLAFASPGRDQVTIVGMNDDTRPARLNLQVQGLPGGGPSSAAYYRTSEEENCHCIGRVPLRGGNWPFVGIDVAVPPASIFTLTTLE